MSTTDTNTTTLTPDPPRAVRIAQGWMYVQSLLGVVAVGLLAALAGSTGDIPGVLWVLLAALFAFYVLVAVLATAMDSRRRWTRATALTVEILLIISGLVTFLTGPNIGTVIGLIIAIVITCYLSAHETDQWFDR
ncbi:MAG TPA: hypothetical protein VFV66_10685 [Nonomuraea sp.]|nr:hypothetical protein [Nonomuraea sp.]